MVINIFIEFKRRLRVKGRERGRGRENGQKLARWRDGRRGVPAAIIRVNYRAVSPFGELLTLSLGQARSLDRSRSLNPVANLYRDWTSYRRASTSARMETTRRMEFARCTGAKVSTTTTTTTMTVLGPLPFPNTRPLTGFEEEQHALHYFRLVPVHILRTC